MDRQEIEFRLFLSRNPPNDITCPHILRSVKGFVPYIVNRLFIGGEVYIGTCQRETIFQCARRIQRGEVLRQRG